MIGERRLALGFAFLFSACAGGGGNGAGTEAIGGEEAPPAAPVEGGALPSLPPLAVADLSAVEGNGATVKVPIAATAQIAVRVMFYSGSIDDPHGKEGLTALTARLVAEGGTERLAYPDLLKALYPMAAELAAQVDKEETVFHVLVHKDHVTKLAPLLAEVLTTPRLGEKDLERIRQDMINDIEKRLRTTDDENLGKAVLNELLYPAGHPYHHLVGGTVEGLKAITPADVKAQWQRVFGKKRMVLGLAGGIDAAVEKTLTDALSKLGEGEPRLAAIPPAVRLEKTRVVIAKKPAKAVAVSMGFAHGAFRGHPDFPALALVQSYFGEHRQFHGVLMSEMREKRGLNYGDYAYVESFIQDGWSRDVKTNIARRRQHFEMWIRPVDPKDAVFATRLALFLRDRLVREGVPAKSLTETAGFLNGYTRLWELTPMRRLGWALDGHFYGSEGWLDQYRAALGGLTKDQVDQAIRRNLSANALAIAMVAEDAEGLKNALLSGEPSVKKYEAQVAEPVLAMDRQMASFPLGVSAEQIEIVPVESLFQR
ncbi:MAG: insulinase family protein [Deltaproteobacteria bacterium]|nr:insulinase family protein [Deltaproteobacteria bacterium]